MTYKLKFDDQEFEITDEEERDLQRRIASLPAHGTLFWNPGYGEDIRLPLDRLEISRI